MSKAVYMKARIHKLENTVIESTVVLSTQLHKQFAGFPLN